MTSDLSTFVAPIVKSFLGPCKSNKVVIDGDDVFITRCPNHLFEKAIFQNHFSYLLEDTLRSHHEQFGCTTTTLLGMWYFWTREFSTILQEGYKISDIMEHSQDILSKTIECLPQKIINIKETLLSKSSEIKVTPIHHNYKSKHESFTSVKSSSPIINVPVGVRYSSRHYSPSQDNLQINQNDISMEQIEISPKLKKHCYSVVEKLSHDDTGYANIVSDLWIRQIMATSDIKL